MSRAEGIESLCQLARISELDITRVPNVGCKSLREIKGNLPSWSFRRRSLLTHAAGLSAFATVTMITVNAPYARGFISQTCSGPGDEQPCINACSSACGETASTQGLCVDPTTFGNWDCRDRQCFATNIDQTTCGCASDAECLP